MSKQAWHFGAPERDPAELAEEALAARLLALIERRETSHSASHVLTPETSDSANANKDLDKAA